MGDLLTIAGVCLVLWAGTFLYFRAYLSRRTGAGRILAELREEVEKLVSEVDLATDRDVTLVEDRIKTLRSLLEEADKRIGTMKREAERRLSEERAYTELGRRATSLRYDGGASPAATPSTQPAAAAVSATPVSATPPEPRSPAPVSATPSPAAPPQEAPPLPIDHPQPGTGSRQAPAEPPAAPRFVVAAKPVEPKAAPFFERVAELYKAGFSADLIAKRLGSTIAEVDLAIALSGKMDGRDGDGAGH